MTADPIRTLNDAFRATLTTGDSAGAAELGRIRTTAAIAHLLPEAYLGVLRTVGAFADFNTGNDPHGEHDYGAFDFDGEHICWKIDYLDRAEWDRGNEIASENPADPARTYRVLTIMFAHEN